MQNRLILGQNVEKMPLKEAFDASIAKDSIYYQLPIEHKKLIDEYNGLLGFNGYIRLFGLGTEIDLDFWNAHDTWRFAWPEAGVEEYIFFGGNAYGDQYAYMKNDDSVEKEVYLLDYLSMKPVTSFKSFSNFFDDFFLREIIKPIDEHLINAFNKLTKVQASHHIIQIPSVLITGYDDLNLVTKADAIEAMIINGDVATQLFSMNNDDEVGTLESYRDEEGRNRINIVCQ